MPKAKSKKPFDKESLRKQYEEAYPKYEKLAKALKPVLEKLLESKEIDFLDVYFCIKKFDDFCEKAEGKGMQGLFQDWNRMEDDYAHRGIGVLG